jgi:DNA-binding NarL/FixJ family response regulator
MTPLRVLVVDDHHLFRAGMEAVLSRTEDLAYSGGAATTQEAFELVRDLNPDVVTVDVTLPDGDGISATREILRRHPATRVMMLTMHASAYYVAQSMAAGASGYALKEQAPSEIIDALRVVARGDRYVAPGLAWEPARGDGTGPLDLLSPREREVFDLVVRGRTNVEVADTLELSVKTVETHRAHINRKLRVRSTGALIRLAAVHGLIVT